MKIELTEQQRQLVREGKPIDVVDPQTNEAFVLIPRQQFEELRPPPAPPTNSSIIPEGIRLSQQAFRRALPQLLQQKRLVGQWVAFNRQEQIGLALDANTLLRACLNRGLGEDEFYIGWIDPCELIEEEEVEPRPQHHAERADNDSQPFTKPGGRAVL
jgi:hypothetical protein